MLSQHPFATSTIRYCLVSAHAVILPGALICLVQINLLLQTVPNQEYRPNAGNSVTQTVHAF